VLDDDDHGGEDPARVGRADLGVSLGSFVSLGCFASGNTPESG
jgi:hypothetical protein